MENTQVIVFKALSDKEIMLIDQFTSETNLPYFHFKIDPDATEKEIISAKKLIEKIKYNVCFN